LHFLFPSERKPWKEVSEEEFPQESYSQMGEEEIHSFDPDTEMEDGSKEGR
jgi:hypothetical protein